MILLASALLFALSRAEIIERFRSPVITQADGLIKVYANCPEDMRREFQSPIASFAADTFKTLRQGYAEKLPRVSAPRLVICVGDVRTNLSEVVVRVATNANGVVTRLYVPSPAFADLYRFKLEIIKAYCRAVEDREVDDREAVRTYRMADPEFRVEDLRLKLERWIVLGEGDDEEGLDLMRKVIKPGVASRRDVLIFASRLQLYPEYDDQRFAERYRSLSFREAIDVAADDPAVRARAAAKAPEMPVFGGGRSPKLLAAAYGYMAFLLKLADEDSEKEELVGLLDAADRRLKDAMDEAREREEGRIR